MARFVTQISWQLFWHLITKICQIWWLLAQGVPPKNWAIFYGLFRKRAFRQLMFLKGEKSVLSNMVIYIIWMQILYWFENTNEPMSENQHLSQHVVGLPWNKLIYKKKEGYDWPNQDPPQSGSKILTFHKEYLQWIVHERDLNDLHCYKKIFGKRRSVFLNLYCKTV